MSFISVAPNTAALLAVRRERASKVPGLAAERLAELGDRAMVLDLYDDGGAAEYHAIVKNDRSEVREILAAARQHPGRVLELAAGSGRLTLPLLAAGREVTAIDLSEPMLTLLRAELATLPKERAKACKVVRADMTSFRVRGRFGLLVLGASSVSLLDDAGRANMLARAHRHLEEGAGLVLTTAVAPDGAATGEPEIVTPLPDGGAVHEFWEPGADSRHVTILSPDTGGQTVPVFTSTVRVVPVDTVRTDLEAAGFTVTDVRPVRGESARHVLQLLEAVRR